MTRLPKKRGITQDEEDKSLILRSRNCQAIPTSEDALRPAIHAGWLKLRGGNI